MNTGQECLDLGELPKGKFDKTPQEFIAKRLAESPTGTYWDRSLSTTAESPDTRSVRPVVWEGVPARGLPIPIALHASRSRPVTYR